MDVEFCLCFSLPSWELILHWNPHHPNCINLNLRTMEANHLFLKLRYVSFVGLLFSLWNRPTHRPNNQNYLDLSMTTMEVYHLLRLIVGPPESKSQPPYLWVLEIVNVFPVPS